MRKEYKRISAAFFYSLVALLSLTACRDKSIPGGESGVFGMSSEIVELDKDITFTASLAEGSAPRWFFHQDETGTPRISWDKFTMSSYIYLYSSFNDNDGYYYVYRTVDPIEWTVVNKANDLNHTVTLKPKDEFGLTRKWYKIVVNKSKVPLSEWNQAKKRNPKYTQGTNFYALAVATPLKGADYKDGIPTNQQSFEFYQDGFSRDASDASRFADLQWNVPCLLIDQLGKDIYPIETEAGYVAGAVGHVRGSDLFEMSRFTKSSVDGQGKLKFNFLFEPVGNMIRVTVRNNTRVDISTEAKIYLRFGSALRKRYLFNPRDLKANGWIPDQLQNYPYPIYDTRRWQNIEAIQGSTSMPEGALYSAYSPQYTKFLEAENGWDKQLALDSDVSEARGVALNLIGRKGKYRGFQKGGDVRTFFIQTAQPLFMESMAYDESVVDFNSGKPQDRIMVIRAGSLPNGYTGAPMRMHIRVNGKLLAVDKTIDDKSYFMAKYKASQVDLKSNSTIYELDITLTDR